MADAILLAIIIAPVVVTYFLKSNAALAFLALCAGFVVISFANVDIKGLTKNLSFQLNSSTLNLVLLSAPYLLTLLLRRKAFSTQSKKVLQCAVALCGGALLSLVAIPLLSESARINFANSASWDALQKIQTPVVAIGVLLSLILVWLHKPAPPPDKKHK